ncbi:HupE/UreJ family protein [Dokdonella soli]|uniref:HupE/UreJ family protein n=1 Tax=Dokdonella soli TaxID=529810 RepID=A0ABP3THG1_9GAMM
MHPFRNTACRFRSTPTCALLGITILTFASPATAHMGTGLSGGFAYGFRHPFTGLDHLLAMVSVGLWGAFLGPPLIYVLPVVFPIAMVAGAVLGMLSAPLPPVEIGIALSVLMLGACIAFALKAPIWAASLVVGLFALFHGYAHGRELPSAADPFGYSAGFVFATGLLHVLGIGIGVLNARPSGRVATRGLGGFIAAFGIWFLYRAVGT